MSFPGYLDSLDLSDYDLNNDHSLTKNIVSLNVAFISLIALVIGLRMSVRCFIVHAAGPDDCKSLLIS